MGRDVVVDTSVLFAALLKDGRAREVLCTSTASFHIPAFGLEEALALVPRAARLAKVPEETVRAILDDLSRRMMKWKPEAYRAHLRQASILAGQAQADGDEDFVALALALDAPVWTYDHDFRRIKGLRVLSTAQLLD